MKLGEGVDEKFLNAKVGFCDDPHGANYTGTYAQYNVMTTNRVFIFPDNLEYNQICSIFVNPVTVCGFVDVTQKEGHKAIIHAAAASALGK